MSGYVALLVAWCSHVSAAADGIRLIYESGPTPAARRSTIDIDRHYLRARVELESGVVLAIFDSAGQRLWLVNETQKTYTEFATNAVLLDRESVERTMSPQQQKMMETMRRSQLGTAGELPPGQPESRFQATGKSGPRGCAVHDRFVRNVRVGQVCVAGSAAVGMSLAEFQVLEAAVAWFDRVPQLSSMGILPAVAGLDGVVIQHIADPASGQTMRIGDVRRVELREDHFQVPAGFRLTGRETIR